MPARGLDRPLSTDEALVLLGVSVALLLFGRVLRGAPRPLLRGFGMVGLGAALVLHAFGLAALSLVGIAWDAAGRSPGRDAAFAAGWLAVSAAAAYLAGRVARAFPKRQVRLKAVEAPPREPGEAGGEPEAPSSLRELRRRRR